jgi:hypothetical protein
MGAPLPQRRTPRTPQDLPHPSGHENSGAPSRLLLGGVAVGKTPGELAGSLVRVGSENGHLLRRTQAVRRKGVAHGGSEVHLRGRAACFLTRLCPTATRTSGSTLPALVDQPVMRETGRADVRPVPWVYSEAQTSSGTSTASRHERHCRWQAEAIASVAGGLGATIQGDGGRGGRSSARDRFALPAGSPPVRPARPRSCAGRSCRASGRRSRRRCRAGSGSWR